MVLGDIVRYEVPSLQGFNFVMKHALGGQMGGDRVTTQNLQVLKIIPEQNLLIVKGSFAGCKGSTVLIEK